VRCHVPDNPIDIEIIEKPDGILEPRGGRDIRVKTGQAVIFRAEPGVEKESLQIDFRGKSPLDERVIYGKKLTVTARFVPGDARANTYVFDCRLRKNGRPLHSEGGGQFEIDFG